MDKLIPSQYHKAIEPAFRRQDAMSYDDRKSAMRYFFHRKDGHVDPDNEGVEFSDEDDAGYEAVLFAVDTLKDSRYALWQGDDLRIEVTDGNGKLIFIVVISTSRP